MDINGNIIRTPYDDGMAVEYDPDWRRRVALGWAETRWFPPRHIYYDAYIRKYVEYLRYMNKSSKHRKPYAVPQRFADMADAEAWYAGGATGVKHMLEPLLLSGVDLKHIVQDIIPETRKDTEAAQYAAKRALRIVKLYERLFFNIRDEDWQVCPALTTRTFFALGSMDAEISNRTPRPNFIKFVAAFGGYSVLTHVFKNSMSASAELESQADSIRRTQFALQTGVFEKVLKNEVNNFDSAMIFGKNTEYVKMEHETNAGSNEISKYKELFMQVMKIKKPRLAAALLSTDAVTAVNQTYVDGFMARKRINEHAVADAGVESSVKGWNIAKQANFADQAGRG